MHDPMSVAFEIPRPWPETLHAGTKHAWRYWPGIVVFWHVDPEVGGDDDSCRRRAVTPRAWRMWRWHFWHWRIQVPLVRDFKRWAWGRCCKCGGRFRFGYAPTTDQWDSDGPRWFRSETGIYHNDCRAPSSDAAVETREPLTEEKK